MKALVKSRPETGIWMEEIDVPVPKDDEVLIKVKCASICGTDSHIYQWDSWAQDAVTVPMTIGHEFSGVIEEVGRSVSRISIGDRVTAEGHIVETHSRAARAGRYHLDSHTKGIGIRVPGAFAEYICVPAFNVIALPDNCSFEVGSILDPFGNAVHAVGSFSCLGEDVLITGAGPIGLMTALVAERSGAHKIAITDINPYRLDLARSVTNVRVVDSRSENLKDVMTELGMTEGFDLSFEASGSPAAMQDVIKTTIMGGKIAVIGIPKGKMLIDWGQIIFKALTIKAIYGREMFDTWYKSKSLISSGTDLAPLITHRFEFEDYEQAFELISSGQSGKIILNLQDI